MRSTHSDHLENWLGPYAVDELSRSMRGWYGAPISVHGVPGNVWATGDGDFIGHCDAGYQASCADRARDILRKIKRAARLTSSIELRNKLNVGFSSLSDLATKFQYKRQDILFYFGNAVTSGNVVTDLFLSSGSNVGFPGIGVNTTAAPGGRECTSSVTGALNLVNAVSGEQQYIANCRAWVQDAIAVSGQAWTSILFYDRLFDVAKTMNSTTAEAVTGTFSRYQGVSGGAHENFAGSNFCFPEVTAALPATAHNWTVCTYKNELGNPGTFPSATGNSSGTAAAFDLPNYQWFMPLAAGDVGVSALTQIQCSALVASGSVGFVVGHPLVWFPVGPSSLMFEYEYVTTSFGMVRVFDNACLTALQIVNPVSLTRMLFRGQLGLVSA